MAVFGTKRAIQIKNSGLVTAPQRADFEKTRRIKRGKNPQECCNLPFPIRVLRRLNSTIHFATQCRHG
jgi:hypothetical protein